MRRGRPVVLAAPAAPARTVGTVPGEQPSSQPGLVRDELDERLDHRGSVDLRTRSASAIRCAIS
jgi:hypothetical protein